MKMVFRTDRMLVHLALLICVGLISGCATLEPAMSTESISIASIDEAMKAASLAARDTNWIVKTVDKENGYLLAEREVRVLGRSERPDAYKLEVEFTKSSGENIAMRAKVTPPPGIMGGQSPESMVAEFITAFQARSK
jgi:hypothetical protein